MAIMTVLAIETNMAIVTVLAIETDIAGNMTEASVIDIQLKEIRPTSGQKGWEHLWVI